MEWTSARGRFCHDWVRNRVLVALRAAERLWSASGSAESLRSSLSVLTEWEEMRLEALELVDTFGSEMSPDRLFDRPPLCFMDRESLAWVRGCLRQRWDQDERLISWLAAANQAVQRVDESVALLARAQGSFSATTPSQGELPLALESAALAFEGLCDTLGRYPEIAL